MSQFMDDFSEPIIPLIKLLAARNGRALLSCRTHLCVLWSTSCCSVVKVLVTMAVVSSSTSIFCCISTSRFLRSAISWWRCSSSSWLWLRLLMSSLPPPTPPCTRRSSSMRICPSSSSVWRRSTSILDSAMRCSLSRLRASPSSDAATDRGRQQGFSHNKLYPRPRNPPYQVFYVSPTRTN